MRNCVNIVNDWRDVQCGKGLLCYSSMKTVKSSVSNLSIYIKLCKKLLFDLCSILSLIKQIDKTQPYNDNKKLISVFEKHSICIPCFCYQS